MYLCFKTLYLISKKLKRLALHNVEFQVFHQQLKATIKASDGVC